MGVRVSLDIAYVELESRILRKECLEHIELRLRIKPYIESGNQWLDTIGPVHNIGANQHIDVLNSVPKFIGHEAFFVHHFDCVNEAGVFLDFAPVQFGREHGAWVGARVAPCNVWLNQFHHQVHVVCQDDFVGPLCSHEAS